MSVKVEAGEVLGQCPTCGACVNGYQIGVDYRELPPNGPFAQHEAIPGSEALTLAPCSDILRGATAASWVRKATTRFMIDETQIAAVETA